MQRRAVSEVRKLYLPLGSIQPFLIIPQFYRSRSRNPIATRRTRMTAKSSAASQSRQEHARPTETKWLAIARVERATLIARRDVCCVCHVHPSFTHPLNMSDSNGVTGMPDKSALEEASRLFTLGGSRIEERWAGRMGRIGCVAEVVIVWISLFWSAFANNISCL